jgi:hypothetical protein
VVRRGGPPLPGLRGQPGGEAFMEGSKVPSPRFLLLGRLSDLVEVSCAGADADPKADWVYWC